MVSKSLDRMIDGLNKKVSKKFVISEYSIKNYGSVFFFQKLSEERFRLGNRSPYRNLDFSAKYF